MPRIIAGNFKGLKLVSPYGSNTRPTSDQIKETIFSILNSLPFDFKGARVLDFFAGSGSLGLEALSRGAAEAVFADHNRKSLEALERNIKSARAESCTTVLRTRWPQGFDQLQLQQKTPFDLFFLDPPYDQKDLAQKLLGKIHEHSLARPGACAVWEQASSTLKDWTPADLTPWELIKVRTWTSTSVSFLTYPQASVVS